MTSNDYNNNGITPHNNNSAESEIQFNKIFSKAFYHWPLYVLTVFLAVAFAWVYLRYAKPVFVSAAKIYIKDENKAGASRQNSAFDAFALIGGSKLVENEMEIIKSPLILKEVILNNRFNIRYFEKGKFSEFEVYEKRPVEIKIHTDSAEVGNYFFEITRKGNSNIEIEYLDNLNKKHIIKTRFNQAFRAGKDIFSFSYTPRNNEKDIAGFQIRVDSIAPLAYIKAEELRTALINNKASVFMMVYEDGIARRCADFLNAVAKKYNEYTLDDKNLTALNSIRFIDTRLESLGGELGTIERDVETFKTTRGITQMDENSRLFLEQVKDADQKLDEANIQLSVFDQVEKYINSPGSEATFTPVIGNVDASLTTVINRYQDLQSEKRRLSLSLQPNSIIVQNLDQQIEEVKNTIKNYIGGYRQNAQTARRGLQKKVNQIEGLIAQVPKYEREFINLKRQQSVKEALYLFLLQKKEETAVSYASNIVDNKIISPAFIPINPVKPKKVVVMVVFVMIALVLTSLYILLKYLMNTKINTKRDIEKIFDIPVIAEIFNHEHEKGKKFFDDKNRSMLSEQMLSLRSNLKFLLNDVKHAPVILFTSSISGEGKTFLSAHLGNSMTGNRKRVVLVELDLRKPKLAKSLGISNNSGLTNYLVGTETIDQIIKEVPDANNLFIVPSGPIPPNPVELIESEKMNDFFAVLRNRFDYIIVDTAPAGLVSDAKSLIPYIDCALFVVRFNYTPKSKLVEVADNLTNSKFKRMGLIFNGIEQGSSYGYYSYGYSNYGYGYGYYGEESKKKLGSFIKRIGQRMV